VGSGWHRVRSGPARASHACPPPPSSSPASPLPGTATAVRAPAGPPPAEPQGGHPGKLGPGTSGLTRQHLGHYWCEGARTAARAQLVRTCRKNSRSRRRVAVGMPRYCLGRGEREAAGCCCRAVAGAEGSGRDPIPGSFRSLRRLEGEAPWRGSFLSRRILLCQPRSPLEAQAAAAPWPWPPRGSDCCTEAPSLLEVAHSPERGSAPRLVGPPWHRLPRAARDGGGSTGRRRHRGGLAAPPLQGRAGAGSRVFPFCTATGDALGRS